MTSPSMPTKVKRPRSDKARNRESGIADGAGGLWGISFEGHR